MLKSKTCLTKHSASSKSRDIPVVEALRTLLCFLVLMHHLDVLIPDLGGAEHSPFVASNSNSNSRNVLQNVWSANKVHNLKRNQQLSLAGRFIQVINGYLSVNAFLILSGLVLSVQLFRSCASSSKSHSPDAPNSSSSLTATAARDGSVTGASSTHGSLQQGFFSHFYANFVLRNLKLLVPLYVVQVAYRVHDVFWGTAWQAPHMAQVLQMQPTRMELMLSLPYVIWGDVLRMRDLLFTQHYGGHLYIMWDLVACSVVVLVLHACMLRYRLLPRMGGTSADSRDSGESGNKAELFKKRCFMYFLFVLGACVVWQKWRHFPVILGVFVGDVVYLQGRVGVVWRGVRKYWYLFVLQFGLLWVRPEVSNQIVPRSCVLTAFLMYLLVCDDHVLTRMLTGQYVWCRRFGSGLVCMGRYTYSTYLWHLIVFRALNYLLYPYYAPYAVYDAIIVVTGVVASFCVGYVSYHLLQKRLVKALMDALNRVFVYT